MAENVTQAPDKIKPKRAGGFASMDQEIQREIASKGGRAAHAKGAAHEFTSEEAREAGRKGGESISQDREHMATIGRQGGKQSRVTRRSHPDNPKNKGRSISSE
jgi:uncharacterized protein